MRIRRATRDDIPAIARVHIDTWRTTYRGLVPDEYLAGLSYEKREEGWRWIFDYSDSTDGNFTLVDEDDTGNIVGFANGGPERTGDPEFKGELNAIYIRESAQGRGLGRALVQAVVDGLLALKLDSMILWVIDGNPACKFYEHLGGEYIREKEVGIGGRLVKELAYGWRNISSINK
jgi:ribosomal protein S18 acetylase RimI-like enzyme